MSMFELYLITRCENLHDLFMVVSIISLIVTIFSAIAVTAMSMPDTWTGKVTDIKPYRKYVLILGSVCFVSSLISALLPTTKDIALIYSGHFVTHSEELKKLPDNLLRHLNTYLEKKD